MTTGTERALRHGTGSNGRRWSVLELILWSAEYLRTKGVERARLDAEHLLAHVLGVGRLEMYLQHERPLAPRELDAFRPLLRRRAGREPLQYILRRHAFRELNLEVGPGVFIPRPETELLVGEVLEWARDRERLSVLDLGTGSGAIALALATEGSFGRILATDVSESALDMAGRNRKSAGVVDRVDMRCGPLFEPTGPEERFDVIVSNPPYVAEFERSELQPEVVDWEPESALFAGPDGLDMLRSIVGGAASRLHRRGLLALEVGAAQAGVVADMLHQTGLYHEVHVRRDLAGRERMVLAQRVA